VLSRDGWGLRLIESNVLAQKMISETDGHVFSLEFLIEKANTGPSSEGGV
jgi:hypothetical protein